VVVLRVPDHIRHGYYKYPVMLSETTDRLKLLELMRNGHGIGLGSAYDPPLHLQPLYQRLYGFRRGMFPQAEVATDRTVCLPMFVQMSKEDAEYVVSCLRTALPMCQRAPSASGAN
jgi:dTDP-4-amino-4,6-dideoxygalactose transaminase